MIAYISPSAHRRSAEIGRRKVVFTKGVELIWPLLGRLLLGLILLALFGCGGDASRPERVWGKRGVQNGDFVRPRAIAIDANDRLYIVDFTARIQVYDRE